MKRLRTFVSIFLLCMILTSCDTRTPDETISVTFAQETDHTITELKCGKFTCTSTIFGSPIKLTDTYRIYKDTITDTVFVYFRTGDSKDNVECLIQLVTPDGIPKPYSESDENELVLVEQGDFLILEDTDTKVQYIITRTFSDYIVRLPSERNKT